MIDKDSFYFGIEFYFYPEIEAILKASLQKGYNSAIASNHLIFTITFS